MISDIRKFEFWNFGRERARAGDMGVVTIRLRTVGFETSEERAVTMKHIEKVVKIVFEFGLL